MQIEGSKNGFPTMCALASNSVAESRAVESAVAALAGSGPPYNRATDGKSVEQVSGEGV